MLGVNMGVYKRSRGIEQNQIKIQLLFQKLSECFQKLQAEGLMRKYENCIIRNFDHVNTKFFTNTKDEYDETLGIQLI